jgi:hypothetical protein
MLFCRQSIARLDPSKWGLKVRLRAQAYDQSMN